MNKISSIKVIEGKIKLLSGLHIGGGDSQMKIGGIDNEVIKDQNENPFIPGSSLKGKIRTLLEWHLGFYTEKGLPSNQELVDELPENAPKKSEKANVVKLFGSTATSKTSKGIITRLSFWDCPLIDNKLEVSETKSENSINRTTGTADNPRSMERVPAGNEFEFKLVLKIFENDNEEEFKELLRAGLALLQLDALGGSGSRGYGKVEFQDLKYIDKVEDSIEKIILTDEDLYILA